MPSASINIKKSRPLTNDWRALTLEPVGSFKGTDWQNPVKWVFTFVPYKGKKIIQPINLI
jgi:hypothetical protein